MLPTVFPSWGRRWHDWLALLPSREGFFREILESGFLLCRPSGDGRELESPSAIFLHALLDRLRGAEAPPPPDAIGCDAIVCAHSTAEPLHGAVLRLIAELNASGCRVLYWRDRERRYHGADGSVASCPVLEDFLRATLPPGERLRIVVRALLQTIVWCGLIVLRRQRMLRDLVRHPLRVWAAFADSGLRVARAERLLDAMRPRLVFSTHERFPPASELLAARGHHRPRTVTYHHGILSWYEQPVLSRDVLCWNMTDAGTLAPYARHSRLHVTGNWELAETLRSPPPPLGGDGAPELLYLSQWFGEDEPWFRESCADAVEWLREVAALRPEWRFLVKPRGSDDPTETWLRNAPANIEIVRDDFRDLLRRPALHAVAAYSSSGLYVAAGVGKRALRLRVRHHRIAMPVIDEVCRPVWSAEDWAAALDEAPQAVPRDAFPAGESSIRRAAALCCLKIFQRSGRVPLDGAQPVHHPQPEHGLQHAPVN